MARFAEPVSLAKEDSVCAPAAPWESDDGGLSWSLSRSTSLARIIDAPTTAASSMLLAVADGLFVDLAAAGSLTVAGDRPGLDIITRSLLEQLNRRPETHGVQFYKAAPDSDCPGDSLVLVAPSFQHLPVDLGGVQLTVDQMTVRLGHALPALTVAPRLHAVSDSSPGSRPEISPDPSPDTWPDTWPDAWSDTSPGSSPALVGDKPLVGGGPMLNLLGPIEMNGFGGALTAPDSDAAWCLTSQQLALICFLACAGPVSGATVIDALWDGEAISASRFPNLLAEVRSRIGACHLPRVTGGLYRLQGIGTDLERFEAVVGQASRCGDRSTAELIQAMELVRGVPLGSAGGRYWSWVDSHHRMPSQIEGVIVEAAAWVAKVCIERGDLDGAQVAYERGLLASPLDEGLVASSAQLLVAMGRIGAAMRHVESWEARVRALDCGEPPNRPRSALRAEMMSRRQSQGPAA
ncbi:MAG: hypothetical protein ACRBK7_26110 [Acidimicrobiales bacterium]